MTQVTGQRLIDNLRIILKACLVDGRGCSHVFASELSVIRTGFNDVIMADVSPEVE